MALQTKTLVRYVAIGLVAVCIATLWPRQKNNKPFEIRNYDEIRSQGIIRAVTEYNSISFFADADSLSGFHYEVMRNFARDKGLKLSIVPEMSLERRNLDLAQGKYDVIAYGIPITSLAIDSIALTHPINRSKQVLVQRARRLVDSATYIPGVLALAGKRVYVEKESPAVLRIHNLSREIADTIYVEEVSRYAQEQLIAMVAHADIDYVVADETLARVMADSLPQLDVNTGISFTQLYAWGVNASATDLKDTLNAWIDAYVTTPEFARLHRKYYGRAPER